MIDSKKVQIMTKLAIFEKNEELDALKTARYERLDYVRIRLLRMFIYVTIGYVICVALYGLEHLEEFLNQLTGMELASLLRSVVTGYVIVLLLYCVIGAMAYYIRYRVARRKVKKYDRLLHILRKYYRTHNN